MIPKVLITGGRGQLASDLVRALAVWQVLAVPREELDVCHGERVRETLAAFRPHAVINTAAFHRVDDCESDVGRAFAVNFRGVRNLCWACRDAGILLLHVSTDYVFDGEQRRPYLETDPPNPINVYGLSKLAGEMIVQLCLERYYIVRTSGLFGVAGSSVKGGNFVNTMLRKARQDEPLRVVDDQRLSPTYTRHLAQKIAWLLSTEEYGVYHITGGGSCSWYEFAAAILQMAGLGADLQPTASADFAAPARRPAYSVLGHGRLQSLGADDVPSWQEGLRSYLVEIRASASDEGLRPTGGGGRAAPVVGRGRGG